MVDCPTMPQPDPIYIPQSQPRRWVVSTTGHFWERLTETTKGAGPYAEAAPPTSLLRASSSSMRGANRSVRTGPRMDVATIRTSTALSTNATTSPSPGIPRSPGRPVSPTTDCRSESRIVSRYREDFGVLQIPHALEQATDVRKRRPAIAS